MDFVQLLLIPPATILPTRTCLHRACCQAVPTMSKGGGSTQAEDKIQAKDDELHTVIHRVRHAAVLRQA